MGGPDLGDHLEDLAARGVTDVVSVPVGFVSDHVELLFDVDVRARRVAERVGVRLERPPALNDDPRFVEALAEIVRARRGLAGGARGVRIAVVGGGIAGLAAARRLEALLPDAELALFEREATLGGKIVTEHAAGFLVEGGPDSFLSRKPRGPGLCEEVGLGDELVGRRPENARTYVRRDGRLHPLPAGLTGMVPTDLDALADNPLLSPEAASGSQPRSTFRPPRRAATSRSPPSSRGASGGRRTRPSSSR